MSKIVHMAGLEAPDQLVPAGEGGAHDYATPEFRAVPTASGRRGIRLERAFWRALSTIADRMGIKRSQLISDVLSEAGSDDNATSVLRSYAVHQVETELSTVRQQAELAFALPMMQQAPVPSFAIDRDKRLVRVNAEFNQFLRGVLVQLGNPDRGNLAFNLERPVADIFEELGTSGQSCECIVNITMGTRFRQIRSRMVAVPPHAPTALVGYVINL
ncbi:MAG TPA: ribbon-helix-helix domain-containing protein [Devosia sp.]|jgi:predicted DNA-binding ribbon-helix-helix protein